MRVTSSSFKKRRLSKKKLVRLKMSEIIFPRDRVSGKVEQNRFELKYFSRQEPHRYVCQLMVYFSEFLQVFLCDLNNPNTLRVFALVLFCGSILPIEFENNNEN